MGKYMRRKRGGPAGDANAAPDAAVRGGGVRTRSRSAAAAAVVSGAIPAKRRRQAEAAGSGCYLHLRSRRLFMPARGDLGAEEASTSRLALPSSAASGDQVVFGISRCSSTASSTVVVAARSDYRSGGEAEACESRNYAESSVRDSGCGGRERRETTPSSQAPVDNLTGLEASPATDEHMRRRRRRTPATTATSTAAFQFQSRAKMPAAAEIEEFLAAAEKAQAERFAAKYNFDVALGVPLSAGRFEWAPVATIV